ncbi:hypothetical protein E5675_15300 [Sphingopyxis sp. PAMC25046]|uniref:hypothetical protein n=1 Tax=Sphingopyxis sp. PAMC25046 TaxID=2565556 RepID=UPI00109DF59A|nr:hypothetical protein [Sphingopyxis sp. PAMC25046]QCB55665.1 hypothetical protein E5675_15300 [Sphingopyxis sp. PAMC25046]
MNKTIGGLVAVIILLVGAVMYLFGQQNAAPPREPPAATGVSAKKGDLEPAPAKVPASLRRPVRVGTGGPHADACRGIGSVANLPGGADDFLAVREGPTVKAQRIDKLKDDAPVYICDQNDSGSWIGIVYQANGYLPADDKCRAEENVGSVRPYEGPCLTGWVSAKYLVPRGQDSDESHGPEPAAASRFLFDAEGFGDTEFVAANYLYLRGDRRAEAEGGKVVDRGMRSCRTTGESGKRAWVCRTIYTYEK